MSELLFLVIGCGLEGSGRSPAGVVNVPDEPADAAGGQPAGEGQEPEGGGEVDPWADVDLRVCADGSEAFVDIQDAIDVAEHANVIGVCPGSYGPIRLRLRQDLDIIGMEGPAVTTIDGGADTAVHVVEATLDLRGFTVTGTGVSMQWETDHGGAFTVQESQLTVRDTVVSGVTGPYSLVFDEDVLLMEDVIWENNTNTMLWNLYQGNSATIRRNIVRGGTFAHIALTERLHVLDVTRTVFSGIDIDTGFSAFMLPTDGTGPLALTNNVFYDVDDRDPFGGRLFDFPEVDFRNNIVMGSEAWDLYPFASDYSLYFENGVDYAPMVTGTGNLHTDPMFTDARAGDFTLQPGSPGIDAGDPSPSFNDPDGTRNDLGIYGGP